MAMSQRSAIISAGASGIGLAIARALAADGWLVHVCDRDGAAIKALRNDPAGIRAERCDVSDAAEVEAFFLGVKTDLDARSLRGIDLLVNNAGIAGPTGRLEDLPIDGWRDTIDTNLNGTFYMTRCAIPLLRIRAPHASIINMASNAGLMGCPLRGPYVASKWAMIGLSKTLAMELGPIGIRVNAICPASVEGARIERVIAADAETRGLSNETVAQEYKRQSSLRSFATPDDIVAMVRFLTSPGAQRISGQALAIDGHTESLAMDLGA